MAFAYAGIKVDLDDASFSRSVNDMKSLWKSSMDSMANEARAFDTRWQEATAGIKDTKRIVSGILVSQAFYTLSNVMIDASMAAVQFSKDMETAAISMEYFVKGADKAQKAAAYLREINEFAARTPFSTQEALSLSKYMQAMGVGMEQTKSFLGVITDTAAATGATEQNLQRITFGLGQMLTKGRLANEEIRQLANANIPIYEILQEQLGLTGDQISKIGNYWVSADKAVVAILKGLEKRYEGAADRVAETVTGMTDTIRDDMLIITQQAGSGVFDAFADKMKVLRDALDRYRETSTTLGSAGLFTQILNDLNASGPIGDYVLALIGNVRNLAGALSQAAVAASPLFKLLGTTAYTEVSVLSYSLTALCNAVVATIETVDDVTDSMGFAGDATKKFGVGLASLFIAYKAAQAVSFVGQGVAKLGYGFINLTTIMGNTIPIFARQSTAFKMIAGGALGAVSALIAFTGVYKAVNNMMAGFNPASSGALPDDYMTAYDKYAAEMDAYNQQIQQYQESYQQPFENIVTGGEEGTSAFEDIAAASKKAAKSVKSDWVAAFDEVYTIPDQASSNSGTIPTPPDFGSLLSPLLYTFPSRDANADKQPEFPWSEVFGGSPLDQTIASGIDKSAAMSMLINGILGLGIPILLSRLFAKNGSVNPEGGGNGGTSGKSKTPLTPEEIQLAAKQKVEELAKTVKEIKEKLANASGELVDPITKELKAANTALTSAVNKYALNYGTLDDIKGYIKDLIDISEPQLRQKQLVSKFNEVIDSLKTQDLNSKTLVDTLVTIGELDKAIKADLVNGNAVESEMLAEVREARSRLDLLSEMQSKLEKIESNSKEIALNNQAMAAEALQRATNPKFSGSSIQESITKLIDSNKALGARVDDLSSILRTPLNADEAAKDAAVSKQIAANKAFIINFDNHMMSRLDDVIRPLNILQTYSKSFLYKYSQPLDYLTNQVAKILEITQYTKEMPEITKAIKEIHMTVATSVSQQKTITATTIKKLQDNLVKAFKQYGKNQNISKTTVDSAIDVINDRFATFEKTNKSLDEIKNNMGLMRKAADKAATAQQFNEMNTYRAFIARAEKIFKDQRVPAAKIEERLTKLFEQFRTELIDNGSNKAVLQMLDKKFMELKDSAYDRYLLKEMDKIDDTLHGMLEKSGRHLTSIEESIEDAQKKLIDKFGPDILKEELVKDTFERIATELEDRRDLNRFVYGGMTMDKMPEKLKGKISLATVDRLYNEFIRTSRVKASVDGKILNAIVSSNKSLLDKLPATIRDNVIFANNVTNGKLATVLSASEVAGVVNGRSGYNMTYSEAYINNLNAKELNLRGTAKTVDQLISMTYGHVLQDSIVYATDQMMKIAGTGLSLAPGRLMFSDDASLQAEIDAFVKYYGKPVSVLDAKVLSGLNQLMQVVEKESFGPELAGMYELTEKGFKDLITLFDDAFYQFVAQSSVAGVDTIYASFLDVNSLNVKKPDPANYRYNKYDLASPDEFETLQRIIENDVIDSIDNVPNLLESIKQNIRIIKMTVPKDLKELVQKAAKAFQVSLTYAPELARLGKLEDYLQIMTKDGMTIGPSSIRELTSSVPEPHTGNRELNTAIRSITSDLLSEYKSIRDISMTRLEGLIGQLQTYLGKEIRDMAETSETYGKLLDSRFVELRNYKYTTGSDTTLKTMATKEQLDKAIQHLVDVKSIVDNRGLTLIRQFDDVKKRLDFLATQEASLLDKDVKQTVDYAQSVFSKLLDQFGLESNEGAVVNAWKNNGAVTEPFVTDIGTATYKEYLTELNRILSDSGISPDDLAPLRTLVESLGTVQIGLKTLESEIPQITGNSGIVQEYKKLLDVLKETLSNLFSKLGFDSSNFFNEALGIQIKDMGINFEAFGRNLRFGVSAAGNAEDAVSKAYAAFKNKAGEVNTIDVNLTKWGNIINKIGEYAQVLDVGMKVYDQMSTDKAITQLNKNAEANGGFAYDPRMTSKWSNLLSESLNSALEDISIGKLLSTGKTSRNTFEDYSKLTEEQQKYLGSKYILNQGTSLFQPLPYAMEAITGNQSNDPIDKLFDAISHNKNNQLTDEQYLVKELNKGIEKSQLAVVTDLLMKTGDTDSDVAREFYKKYGKYMDTVIKPMYGMNADWNQGVNELLASAMGDSIKAALDKKGYNIDDVSDITPELLPYFKGIMTDIRDQVQKYYLDNEINPRTKYNTQNDNPIMGDLSVYLGKGLDLSSISTDLKMQLRDTLGVTFRDIKGQDGHSTDMSQMNIDSEAIKDNIIGWTQALPKNIQIGEVSTDDAMILAKMGVQINSDGTVTFMKAMNENSTGTSRDITIKTEDVSKAVADALRLKGLELDFSGAETKLDLDVPKLAGEMHSALFMLNDSLTGEISGSMEATLSGLGKVLDSGYLEITNKAVLNGSMTITEYINSLGSKANELSPEVVKALEAIDNVIDQEGQRSAEAIAKWADGISIPSPIKEEQLTDEIRAQFQAIGVTFQEEAGKFYAVVNRPGQMLENGISLISKEDWNNLDANIRNGLTTLGITFTENAGIMMLDFNSIMKNGLSDVVELYVNNPELWDQMPKAVIDALEACGFATEEGMIKIDTTMLNRWTEISGHFYQSWSTVPQCIKDSLQTASIETNNGLMEIQRYVEGMDTTGALVKSFEELPPTLQAYLKDTAGVVEGEKVVITNATQQAFMGFAQTVSETMASAKDDTESNIKAMTKAITDGMLAVNRIMQVTSKASRNPFDNDSRPQWKQTASGWQVTYGGRTYVSPGSQTKGQAREYIQKATGVDIPFAAYGGLITQDMLIHAGEFGKKEAIIPLEQPSVMAKLGASIAETIPMGANMSMLITSMIEQFSILGGVIQFGLSGSTDAITSQIDKSSNDRLSVIETALSKMSTSVSEIAASITDASSRLSSDITSAINQVASLAESSRSSSSSSSRKWQDSWHDADGNYMYDDVYAANGGMVKKQGWYMLGERDKEEVVLPLQSPSILSNVGRTIAGYIDMSGMYNGGVDISGYTKPQQQQQSVDTAALTRSILETVLPMIGSTGEDDKTPVYVGTLVADDRGLKELERRLYAIRQKEDTRRS